MGGLRKCLDKFAIFITHIREKADDHSYKSKDRAKFSGYLKEWNKTKMIVNIAFYLHILEPAKVLSLSLQNVEIDTVNAIRAIRKSKSNLQKLKDTDVIEFLSVKSLIK